MASHLKKENEEGRKWWEVTENLMAVRDYAIHKGLLLRASGDEKDDRCVQAAVTLLPSLFPTELFQLAKSVQKDLNLLVDAVSRDHDFITQALGSVIKLDEFTRNIYELYREVHRNNKQTCVIGLHRMDYMADCPSPSPPSASIAALADQLCLRQIEMNTISSAASGLGSLMKGFHEFVQSRYAVPRPYRYELPDNPCMERFPETLACAWRAYGNSSAYLLMVVHEGEKSVYDQKMIEFALWKRHRIPTMRRTLIQLADDATLGPDRKLFVSGVEVAVVYYRSGYSPQHYPSAKVWGVRRLMEMSRASSCPSAAYQLVGTKKMQQVLAEPGVLERFVKDPTAVARIRSTFAGLYSLDMTPEGDAAVEMALKDSEQFVMKPQREGGGNNYFGKDIHTLLQKIGSSREREAYILMERVRPRTQDGLLFKRHMFSVDPKLVIGELGIYGAFVRCGDEILLNFEAGHVLRTKPAEMDEGGGTIGVSVLDTPCLVPRHNFIKLTSPGVID